MVIENYLFVLLSGLLGDEDISIFYTLDCFIDYLSSARSITKNALLNELKTIHDKIFSINNDIYGKNAAVNLYQFRTLDDFFARCKTDFIKSNNNGNDFDKLYLEIYDDLYSLISDYCSIFPASANGNAIEQWYESAPKEAYHPLAIEAFD